MRRRASPDGGGQPCLLGPQLRGGWRGWAPRGLPPPHALKAGRRHSHTSRGAGARSAPGGHQHSGCPNSSFPSPDTHVALAGSHAYTKPLGGSQTAQAAHVLPEPWLQTVPLSSTGNSHWKPTPGAGRSLPFLRLATHVPGAAPHKAHRGRSRVGEASMSQKDGVETDEEGA